MWLLRKFVSRPFDNRHRISDIWHATSVIQHQSRFRRPKSPIPDPRSQIPPPTCDIPHLRDGTFCLQAKLYTHWWWQNFDLTLTATFFKDLPFLCKSRGGSLYIFDRRGWFSIKHYLPIRIYCRAEILSLKLTFDKMLSGYLDNLCRVIYVQIVLYFL